MKFEQKMVFDFPPEVTEKYMTDEKALKDLADKHPDLVDIKIVKDTKDGDIRNLEMLYTVAANMPGPLKKVMGGAATQSMTMKLSVNSKDSSGTMEMIPGQMADKIKVTGKVITSKEGDKWVQRVNGDASVKIFGIGKMAEKFLVEQLQTSTAHENRIRNEYMHRMEKS